MRRVGGGMDFRSIPVPWPVFDAGALVPAIFRISPPGQTYETGGPNRMPLHMRRADLVTLDCG